MHNEIENMPIREVAMLYAESRFGDRNLTRHEYRQVRNVLQEHFRKT